MNGLSSHQVKRSITRHKTPTMLMTSSLLAPGIHAEQQLPALKLNVQYTLHPVKKINNYYICIFGSVLKDCIIFQILCVE